MSEHNTRTDGSGDAICRCLISTVAAQYADDCPIHGKDGTHPYNADHTSSAMYWQARALRAEAKLAEFDATLTEGEAWAHAREEGLT